jgi:hypothetical protein
MRVNIYIQTCPYLKVWKWLPLFSVSRAQIVRRPNVYKHKWPPKTETETTRVHNFDFIWALGMLDSLPRQSSPVNWFNCICLLRCCEAAYTCTPAVWIKFTHWVNLIFTSRIPTLHWYTRQQDELPFCTGRTWITMFEGWSVDTVVTIIVS